MAAKRRKFLLEIINESRRGRLLRKLAPPTLHVLFRVLIEADVSRARDDRSRGPETIRNSKHQKKVVSRRQNTCLWEAIITNLHNVGQFGAEPHKVLAAA